jgi:O-antigen/teichoic acid export membrane protein
MSEQYITTSKRLIHNTIFNVMTLVSSALITFFLIRFFLSQLGESRYGIWVLIGSIFQYRRLLDMGMNSSINRYIPVGLAKGDDEVIQRVLSTSLFFFSVAAVVFILLSLVIYFNIGAWFSIASDMVGTAGLLVLIVGSCFALAMPLQLSSALLSGLQRYDVLNLAELIILLLRSALIVILLRRGFGLLTMGFVFGISEIAVRLVQFVFARKLLVRTPITLKSVDFKLMREMLAYGINTFLYTMGALILFKASDVIIAMYIGTEQVSQFAVAIAGVVLLSQFLRAFTAAIKPAVSDLDARDDHWRVREISFLMQKYSLLMIIPAGCFLIVMGREFLQVWVGEEFQNPAVVNNMSIILAILTVGHCMRLAQHSNFVVLVGKGEHRLFGLFAMVTALLCVVASVVSIKMFNLGLLAVAWSNCLPVALISGVILPIYFNRKMKISMRDSIVDIWWPASLGGMPAVIMICSWKYLYPPTDWLSIIMVVLSAVLLTCLSAWYLSFTQLERNRLIKTLMPCFRKPLQIS